MEELREYLLDQDIWESFLISSTLAVSIKNFISFSFRSLPACFVPSILNLCHSLPLRLNCDEFLALFYHISVYLQY